MKVDSRFEKFPQETAVCATVLQEIVNVFLCVRFGPPPPSLHPCCGGQITLMNQLKREIKSVEDEGDFICF